MNKENGNNHSGNDISGIFGIVVALYLSQVFGYRVGDRDKSLLIVSKGVPHSSADKSMPKYYVRANTSKLGIGKDTVDVDVSENFYNDVEVGTYHDFTVVTDTIFTGKKRVRIYY